MPHIDVTEVLAYQVQTLGYVRHVELGAECHLHAGDVSEDYNLYCSLCFVIKSNIIFVNF